MKIRKNTKLIENHQNLEIYQKLKNRKYSADTICSYNLATNWLQIHSENLTPWWLHIG